MKIELIDSSSSTLCKDRTTAMTFYEIVILDYGKDGQRTKLICEKKRSKAFKILAKYQKRYHNIRMQKVVTKWLV